MYKLILHHVYRSTAPFVDVSGHGNHAQGQHVGWDSGGMTTNSGAAVFDGVTSRTLVPLSPIWLDLNAHMRPTSGVRSQSLPRAKWPHGRPTLLQ